MKHEKIIKKEHEQVKIIVSMHSDMWRKEFNYSVEVRTKQPRKQKWRSVYNSESYFFRGSDLESRKLIINNAQLKHATSEEILAAKLELWEQMKPT